MQIFVAEQGRYADATIACDGEFFKVHKFVLSSCSNYFEEIFNQTDCKHPVIVLKDIKRQDLELILTYMYSGEVNVAQNTVGRFIDVAKSLMVKGLTERELISENDSVTDGTEVSQDMSSSDASSAPSKKRSTEKSPILQAKRRKTEGGDNAEVGDTAANGSVPETGSSITHAGGFSPQYDDNLIATVKMVGLKRKYI